MGRGRWELAQEVMGPQWRKEEAEQEDMSDPQIEARGG